MGQEKIYGYTICKKSLNTNIKKTLGKNRGTPSAKKCLNKNNQKGMGKEEK